MILALLKEIALLVWFKCQFYFLWSENLWLGRRLSQMRLDTARLEFQLFQLLLEEARR